MDNIFYVYFHRRLDNNQVFYIGKGKNKRAYDKKRSEYWHRIANKYGYSIEFFATNLTEKQAFDIEIEQIDYYRSIGVELCNIANGGLGLAGIKKSPETKLKMSKSRLGYVVKESTKEKLRQINLGKKPTNSIPVVNQFGDVFASQMEASRWANCSFKDINSCCCNQSKSAGRHPKTGEILTWVNIGDEHLLPEKIKHVEMLTETIKTPIINQFGDVFQNAQDASKWCNSKVAKILECCRNKRKSSGKHPITGEKLTWCFIHDKDKLQQKAIDIHSRFKKVITQFGDSFTSIKEAAKWCNTTSSHIGGCCMGKRKSAGSHPVTGERLIWKYVT